jgi:hypothetical protein
MSNSSNSTDPSKPYGCSIRFSHRTSMWTGYSWERVTCFQVDSWPITDDMTETEARHWLANG